MKNLGDNFNLKKRFAGLKERLLVEEIYRKIDILENTSDLSLYARRNKKMIRDLDSRGFINHYRLEKKLKSFVKKQFVRSYIEEIKTGISADHLSYPEYLAYALEQQWLSNKEITQILFDHGDNAENFSERYGYDNLLQTLRKNFLNPYTKNQSNSCSSFDHHPACC